MVIHYSLLEQRYDLSIVNGAPKKYTYTAK